jgi:hypothetical protein
MAADRPALSGTWQLDLAHSQLADAKLKAATWSIAQNDDSVQISETVTDAAGKQKKIEIQCGTEGQQCNIKENGQPTQVSMYYNGSHLVMLEQWHGTDYVTKKRLQISPDGKTLTVEVVHIAPPGRKDESWTFVKQ